MSEPEPTGRSAAWLTPLIATVGTTVALLGFLFGPGVLGGSDERSPAVTTVTTAATPATSPLTATTTIATTTIVRGRTVTVERGGSGEPAAAARSTPSKLEIGDLGDALDSQSSGFDRPARANIAGIDVVALSAPVYPSGLSGFNLRLQRRYDTVTGIVGIDAATACPQNAARIVVTDELDRVVWPEQRVGIREHHRFEIDARGVLVLKFRAQAFDASEDVSGVCASGRADVAWGEIVATP